MVPVLAFYRWSLLRGLCARGWWLVTSVYLVLVAGLEPAELVFVGTGAAVGVLAAEVPAGVFADVVSRKWSIALAHVVSASGMVLTGLTTSFPVLCAAQALWALGWAFSSGADVAWITDELDRPDLIDRVLATRARWELTGAALGLAVAAAIAAVTSLAFAIVVLGLSFGALAAYVAAAFRETRFRPASPGRRWAAAVAVLRRGVGSARRDRQIAAVIVAWLLINGAGDGFGRLVERRLVNLGFATRTEDIVRFAGLSLASLLLGAAVLRIVEHHVHQAGVARRLYAAGCALGAGGVALFAFAPDARYAVAAVVVVSPVCHPGAVVRALGEIWVNRRTAGEVRATVHSVLSQAEHLGEFVFGVALASVAGAISTSASLTASAVLLAVAGVIALGAERGR